MSWINAVIFSSIPSAFQTLCIKVSTSTTGPRRSLCTWFGEVYSCCCLPLLPQLACNVIETTYKYFFSALYRLVLQCIQCNGISNPIIKEILPTFAWNLQVASGPLCPGTINCKRQTAGKMDLTGSPIPLPLSLSLYCLVTRPCTAIECHPSSVQKSSRPDSIASVTL